MERFDGSMKITPLDGTNYHNWKFRMGLLLIARKLFEYVTGEIKLHPGFSDEEEAFFKEKDSEARAIISLHVSDNQLVHIRNCKSAEEMWKLLKEQFQRKSPVKRINLKDKISFTRMRRR
eukprot:gene2022-2299_t